MRVLDDLAGHVLMQSSAGSTETWWLVRPDGGWFYSACVMFVRGGGTIITGDLILGEARVCMALGYDRDWFVSKLDRDYLCSKFLRESFQPEKAARIARETILESRRDRSIDAEGAREAWESAERLEDDPDEKVAFGSTWLKVFGDWPMFGSGYCDRDADNLVAIQHHFRDRWWKLHGEAARAA